MSPGGAISEKHKNENISIGELLSGVTGVVVVVVVQSSLSMYICTMPVLATDWTLTTFSSCYHDPNLEIL